MISHVRCTNTIGAFNCVTPRSLTSQGDDKKSKTSEENHKEKEIKEMIMEDQKNVKTKDINKYVDDKDPMRKVCKCQLGANYVCLPKLNSAEYIKNNQEKGEKILRYIVSKSFTRLYSHNYES